MGDAVDFFVSPPHSFPQSMSVHHNFLHPWACRRAPLPTGTNPGSHQQPKYNLSKELSRLFQVTKGKQHQLPPCQDQPPKVLVWWHPNSPWPTRRQGWPPQHPMQLQSTRDGNGPPSQPPSFPYKYWGWPWQACPPGEYDPKQWPQSLAHCQDQWKPCIWPNKYYSSCICNKINAKLNPLTCLRHATSRNIDPFNHQDVTV